MKYFPLVWAALWRKKVRTIFTFLSVVIAFVLFGILSGVSGGFAHVLDTARLDRLFTDPRFGTPLPLAYVDQIARVPGITVLAPRTGLVGYYKERKNGMGVVATDARFFAVRPEILASKKQIAAMTSLRTGAIIGSTVARQHGFKLGDKIPLISSLATKDGGTTWTFDVVAIVDDADHPDSSNWFVANYKYIDDRRVANPGTVDRILSRIKDPGQATQISRKIDALFANSPAPTRSGSEKSSTQSGLQSLGDINFFTHAIIGAVLFMLLFLTGNSMVQSVRERIPEFAVLKTIGFSDGGVLSLVLAEALLLCVLAGLTGLILVKAIMPLVAAHSSNIGQILLMPWSAFAQGFGFALATAFISALFPALEVRRLSVVDALRR